MNIFLKILKYAPDNNIQSSGWMFSFWVVQVFWSHRVFAFYLLVWEGVVVIYLGLFILGFGFCPLDIVVAHLFV